LNRTPLIGVKFGRLRVTEIARTDRNGVHYKCRCDCGNESIVRASDLMRGRTKSCGCIKRRTYYKYFREKFIY
jgi:hypothetical protein